MWAWIQTKVGLYAGAALAVLVAILYAFGKGRSEGKAVATTQITNDINKQATKVEHELQKVDNQPIDFDAAVGRLRARRTKKP